MQAVQHGNHPTCKSLVRRDGAFRRSELVALEVADLTETPDGCVLIRHSKTDQEGAGAGWARGYRPARASIQTRADNPPGDEPKWAESARLP